VPTKKEHTIFSHKTIFSMDNRKPKDEIIDPVCIESSVFFWVGFAKAKQYPWAEKFETAAHEHLNSLPGEREKWAYINRPIPSLSFAIARGFTWQLTPEGADFWLSVYRSVKPEP